MKKLVLVVMIVGIFLSGCQTTPGGAESSPDVTSSTAESAMEGVSSAQTEDVSSEISDEESYTVVETYGERFSLISRTVMVSNQGVISQYEELALTKGGEILYDFDRGITEVRFKHGFLRVMGDNGEGLLAEDGEEIISLGTVKHVYVYPSWVTTEELNGKGMIYRITEEGLREVYSAEKQYSYSWSYGGISQFAGGEITLLIDEDDNVQRIEGGTLSDLWELHGEALTQFVADFYNTLRTSTWEDHEALLAFLPGGAKEGLESAEEFTGESIKEARGYQFLKALLTSELPLSEWHGLQDVQEICVAPGGCTNGFLEFDLGEEWLDPIIFITAKSDGTFFISYFEGVLK